jgi:hypothetical protein
LRSKVLLDTNNSTLPPQRLSNPLWHLNWCSSCAVCCLIPSHIFLNVGHSPTVCVLAEVSFGVGAFWH